MKFSSRKRRENWEGIWDFWNRAKKNWEKRFWGFL